MPSARRMRPLAPISLLAVIAGALGPAKAQPAPRFDGAWRVDLTCSKTEAGVLGYDWHFAAQVQNGVLHGEYGTKGIAGSMALDGPIKPDGSAVLVADGLTQDPRGSYQHVASGSPFHYHVTAHFTPTDGAGTRVEQRPCTLSFSKR